MKKTFALVVLLMPVGCSDAKSVGYYKAHAAERGRRLDACVAYADFSRDCRNVRQSEFDLNGTPAHDGVAITK
ncbi:EexN family lipoprotein [Sphingomonas sp. PsM26]|nr:EexN family lipoprotein [Sphingomonas sp. PsM26]